MSDISDHLGFSDAVKRQRDTDKRIISILTMEQSSLNYNFHTKAVSQQETV